MRTCLLILFLSTTGCSGCSQEKTIAPDANHKTHEESPDSQDATVEPSAKDSEKGKAVEASKENTKQSDSSSAGRDSSTARQTSRSAEASGSSKGSRSSTSGNKMNDSQEGLSAAEAQERAKKSQHTAQRLASSGDTAKAFQELLTAWQGLQQHPDDPASRALAIELRKALKEYGESLNQRAAKKSERAISRKPLTIE